MPCSLLLFFSFSHTVWTENNDICGCVRCVPAQSTATIKLELLPLTDGIITLDTLQIDVKEKGIIILLNPSSDFLVKNYILFTN